MNDSIVSKLNGIAERLGVGTKAVFHDGDTVGVISSVAPYGKTAVVYGKSAFTERGKIFTEQLKNAGLKPLNFIMPENASLNFKRVFDFIGVPEDVRAIVYFDRELKDIIAYIATIFNIPAVYVLTSINTEGVLPAKVPFFWDNSADFFPVNCVYHVILPKPVDYVDSEDIAEQFVNVTGKLVALSDYQVRLKFYGGKKNTAAYDVIKEATGEVAASSWLDAESALFAGLKIEIADLSANGVITYNSAAYCFKRITGFKTEKGTEIVLLKKLAELYSLCVTGEYPFSVPDYNKRVRELSAVTGSDDGAFLNGFLKQLNCLKKHPDIKKVKAAMKKELTELLSVVKSAEKTYTVLNGKACEDFSPYLKALKLCGDLPDTFNFMTLVRESGFTEFI